MFEYLPMSDQVKKGQINVVKKYVGINNIFLILSGVNLPYSTLYGTAIGTNIVLFSKFSYIQVWTSIDER